MRAARIPMVVVAVLAGGLALATAGPGKFPAPAKPLSSPWKTLEPGLELGTFQLLESHGEPGTATVHVVRIDPKNFHFTLLNASAPGEGTPRTAKDWCTRHGMIACVNASMYKADQSTSVGLMRGGGHVNNPHRSADNAVLAFDPFDVVSPSPHILDRSCDGDAAIADYGTVAQSIRMIDCDGKNVWAPSPKRWSTAAIGEDAGGHILFLHVRDALPVHDLVDGLMGLSLGITRLMYVEGGPESQVYVNGGGEEHEFIGSYESGFLENDDNNAPWPVPNVIGVARVLGTAGR
jgi:hypothetical protein